MKKITWVCSIIIFLSAGIYSCHNTSASVQNDLSDISAVKLTDQAAVERGKYLACNVMGCIYCHSKRDYSKFSGPVVPGTEGMGGERFGPEVGVHGVVYGSNITPAAIGDWSDEDLINAITRGLRKNGDTLYPVMPYQAYSEMCKEDLTDIIKYIRSLKPIENNLPPRELFKPIAMALPKQLPKPNLEKNRKPDRKDKVKYGEYLFRQASCSDCHTPKDHGIFDFTRYAGGGNRFEHENFVVNTPNITPDTSGIASWTEKMFLQKFRGNSAYDFVERDPGKFNTYMPWSLFGKMKDEDLKSIYAYLRTVKPVSGRVDLWESR